MSLNKVLITGSGSGLGKHLAMQFSKKGHDIILHGRNEENLLQVQEDIKKVGVTSKYIVADLCVEDELILLCEKAKKENIKILINNAGITCPNLEFKKISFEIIENMIKVNMIAPIKIINFLNPTLKNVININSMVGMEAKKNRTLYAASKWGLRGFSDSLKKEECCFNILDVYPTNIKTWQDRENAMEVDYVTSCIYESMLKKKSELILDGRK